MGGSQHQMQNVFNFIRSHAPGLFSLNFKRGTVPVSTGTRSLATEVTRKQTYREYFLSTHFWGPLANWGFVVAGLADATKPPKQISGWMTSALCVYSILFMRFAWMVQPRN